MTYVPQATGLQEIYLARNVFIFKIPETSFDLTCI